MSESLLKFLNKIARKGWGSMSETREQQARELIREHIPEYDGDGEVNDKLVGLLARALAACARDEAKWWVQELDRRGICVTNWHRERLAGLERAAGEGKS